MNDFDKKLDFDSDTFENMKHDMNFVLQRLLGNMIEKQSNEGSMTIKIDVTMVKEFIPNYDPNIKGESRKISKPQFKHKVTSAVKITDEKGGNLNNEMEMVMDEETGCYVLQPIANTQQRTIFDSDSVSYTHLDVYKRQLQNIQGNPDEEERIMAGLNAAKLLIIDDLGAERSTDYALEKVYNIIDSRYLSGKPLILTCLLYTSRCV